MAYKTFVVERTEDESTQTAGPATLNRADVPPLVKVFDDESDIVLSTLSTNEIVSTKNTDYSAVAVVDRVAKDNLNPVTSNAVYALTEWERGDGTVSATDWIDTSEGFSCPFYVNRALGLCMVTATMHFKNNITYTSQKVLISGLPKAKSMYTTCGIISNGPVQGMIDFTTSGTIRTGNVWSGTPSVGDGWLVVSAMYLIDDSERS